MAEEQINAQPMVTTAIMKSPTLVDERGRTTVVIELEVHGFTPELYGLPLGTSYTNGRLRVPLVFRRDP